jgi:hypothetical protein
MQPKTMGRQARDSFMRHGAAHPKHARQLAFRRGLIADEQLAVKDELFKLRSHACDQADLALDGSK